MNSSDRSFGFLVILLIGAMLLLARLFFDFVTPLFFAALLTGITMPFYRKMSAVIKKRYSGKKTVPALFIRNNRQTLSSLFTVCLIVVLIVIPLLLVGLLFVNEAGEIYSQISGKITGVSQVADIANSWIEKVPFVRNLYQKLVGDMGLDLTEIVKDKLYPVAQSFAGNIFKYAGALFGNTVGVVLNGFIMLLGIFFMLKSGPEIGHFLIRLSPLKTRDEIRLYEVFREIGRGVIIGNTVAALVQGVLAGMGLFLFSVPKPVFLGVLATFFSFIPFLGPLVVCVPAALYLLYVSKGVSALLLLVYSVLLVSSADNLVKPLFIGDSLKVHPFLILLSILGGLKIFGVMGIFYGPLIVTIFLTLSEIYILEVENE